MWSTAFRLAVGIVCGYESFACFTRKVPTISEFVGKGGRKGDVLGGVILGGLAVHFLVGS